MNRIAIIDYGVGNLHSLVKVFEELDQSAFITEEAEEILTADALILPGVGAFKAGMEGLKVRGLIPVTKKFAKSGKPILGICLGAQLLLSEGFEFGKFKGLNIIPGKVAKFPKIKDKIPHIGWNEVYEIKSKAKSQKSKWKNTILNSIPERSDVYFVHSYILRPDKKDNILALAKYGGHEFCAAIKHGNIYGCQFHPEKSGKIGLKIIKNFIDLI